MQIAGANVKVFRIQDPVQGDDAAKFDAAELDAPVITKERLLAADCIIIGAPGRPGGMAGEVRLFLDSLTSCQSAAADGHTSKLIVCPCEHSLEPARSSKTRSLHVASTHVRTFVRFTTGSVPRRQHAKLKQQVGAGEGGGRVHKQRRPRPRLWRPGDHASAIPRHLPAARHGALHCTPCSVRARFLCKRSRGKQAEFTAE